MIRLNVFVRVNESNREEAIKAAKELTACSLKEEGCIAVEMELAGVQAICDFYGFELYDFLVAGDVLIEGNYETDGLSAANHDLDKLFLALQIAKNMRIEGR